MKFGGMFEIAIFMAFIGVCLYAAFTSLHHTTQNVKQMQEYRVDTRQLQQRDSSRLDYAYLGRPGGYLDAARLSMSIGSASADRRANIRIFEEIIEPYDMYSLNVSEMSNLTPWVYSELRRWWNGFKASPEYLCPVGDSCVGSSCGNAVSRIYDYSSTMKSRTFTPTHVNDAITGFLTVNPKTLEECRFKLQVVEVGQDAEGVADLEYHIFVFLGSLVKQTTTTTVQIEYRWYECVIGSSSEPWLQLD